MLLLSWIMISTTNSVVGDNVVALGRVATVLQ
jgi:hypothetical protein